MLNLGLDLFAVIYVTYLSLVLAGCTGSTVRLCKVRSLSTRLDVFVVIVLDTAMVDELVGDSSSSG